MGFEEGRIVVDCDNDNGIYYAGQTVNAKLVFDQDKVKTFRGIYAKIKGYCQVHWTSTNTRRVPDGHGGHRSESYTVTHESHEVYVERKIYLVGGESGEHRIHPGKHEFPFSFPLPANCPSSFEGEYGHIRYEIKVVVDRAFKFNQEKKISLRVFAPLDLNMDPYCSEPIEMQFEDSYCCCCTSSGSCETFVKLPNGGYCPRQVIPIEVKCTNQGTVEIETITFSIEQDTVFHATNVPATKSREDTVAKLKKGPIPGNTTRTWTVEMEVPTMDVFNVATCQYINIDYTFKVKVSPEGCHDDSTESRRLVIGNIPLRGYQVTIPSPMQDQMPKQNSVENYQTGPNFGPVVSQPMPTVTPYPTPNPYPGVSPYPGNSPFPGANPPYPGANPPYTGASPYPAPHPPGIVSPYPQSPYPAGAHPVSPYPAGAQPVSPYPAGTQPVSPYPAGTQPVSPYPAGAQPVSPYPPPYTTSPVIPSLPPGANVPYPTGPTSPFTNASAPGLIATPDSANTKNPMDDASNPPFNPNFKA